jgi:hypothetical protein
MNSANCPGASPSARRIAAWLVLALCLLPRGAAAGFVYASDTEFTAAGDFDGDGREDVVLVDRATGAYRIGYGTAAGTWNWVASRASGVEGVTGVSLGRLFSLTQDAIALTSPQANRVNVCAAADPVKAANPVSVFVPSTGPNVVMAADIGGAGNTPLDDLVVGTAWNDPPKPARVTYVRDSAGGFSTLSDAPLNGPLHRANLVRLETGQPLLVGAMLSPGPGDEFHALSLTTGAAMDVAALGGLPAGSAFVSGPFSGGPLHQFLFYRPGGSNLVAAAVTKPTPTTYGFSPTVAYVFAQTIEQVLVLSGSSPRLLVLLAGGASAGAYSYNGASPPVLIESLSPAGGNVYGSAVPLAGGQFALFSGAGAGSTRFDRYQPGSGGYALVKTGVLPQLTRFSGGANVFLFAQEPFVSATPNLLQSLDAGDWTSLLTGVPGAPPTVGVTVESFVDSGHGLDNPTPVSLGPGPSAAQFGLVNQVRSFISLRSLAPAIGAEVSEVLISPPAGPQKKSVVIALTATAPLTQVRYRLAPGDPWTGYSSPFVLFKTTTVEYFAKPLFATTQSAIHTATYTFDEPPEAVDSSKGGVPDFVKLGLDRDNNGVPDYLKLGQPADAVLGAKDSDGDGFSDLNELVAGTDPFDPLGKPAAGQRLEEQAGFDLELTPRPLDGTVPTPSLAAVGAGMRTFTLEASLDQFTVTTNLGIAGVTDPAARFTNVIVDIKDRWLAVATDPHYDIATGGADKRLGRELLKLVAVPAVQPKVKVAYAYGGGSAAAEAAAWVAAAQAAYAAVPHVTIQGDLAPRDTLVALLAERAVSGLMHSRGLASGTNITLFGFRPSDAARYVPSQREMLSLETRLDVGHPGHALLPLLQSIGQAVGLAATPDVQALVRVTAEIYRLSSASNNASPGTYPSPVNVLRDFIETGVLHSNYLAVAALTMGDLAAAASGVAAVLAAPPARPTDTLVLEVAADSFGSTCTRLRTVLGHVPKNLCYSDGTPYTFPEAFSLLVGSQVRVFGYTDAASPNCAGDAVEVISIALDTLPAVSTTDSDGDLLPDAWELFFFGHLSVGPYGDADGDSASNLEEYLDGTDPRDAHAKGVPVSLLPPPLVIGPAIGGALALSWSFPEPYASKLRFGVMATDDLGLPFNDAHLAPTHLPGGRFEIVLPPAATDQRYYRLYLSLP